jgi:DNA (cytosine-5)-methyltransferase 1
MRTVAFCEIDPFCRRVLAKHWPGVPCYDDVRTLDWQSLSRDVGHIDIIAGGFPCQDVSEAGARAGIDGSRSGLWVEFARLVGEIRPQFAIVENTPGLLSLGMGRVLGDLAALGLDAEWESIPAGAIGAPHQRDRVWIVAYPPGHRREGELRQALAQALDDISSQALGPWHGAGHPFEQWEKLLGQSAVCRVADGVSSYVDIRPRLHAYGDTVMPQIVEAIGRSILCN